jgi:pyruvate/2-oxoglutarate dehydrogenase complex dihydrolipoamide acyltransferase (E2) component
VSSLLTDTEMVDVTMPQMGVSVAEGTIVAWHVAVGDRVSADQTVCEVSTDKIDTEVPAPAAGRITELLVELDATVAVGTPLARIDTGTGPARPGATAEAVTAESSRSGDSVSRSGTDTPLQPKMTYYSPVVQRIAADRDVDLGAITGTGRNGRVTKQDVLAAASSAPAAEAPMHTESPYRPDPPDRPDPLDPPGSPDWPDPPYRLDPPGPASAPAVTQPPPRPAPVPQTGETPPIQGATLSRMRRQIGAHMKRSQDTAATCTTWMEADMTAVEAARRASGMTALPYVTAAAVAALRAHPALNATLEGERYTVHAGVHLGIAVSLGAEGLIVPVIHDAHELSVAGLSARIRDLARRARANQLNPDEVRGASFTVTNPGQYGSIMATPVINQPQVAILDLEAVIKRPVVITAADGSDAIAIRAMTILGLSWDHRALDGVLAAQFLATLRDAIEATPPPAPASEPGRSGR